MKLSIITVNLNNRDGLKKTIDSVVSQTFTDFEWIVIDGGSTDGSKELIEEYSSHFAYWVSEPDKGIYNAMNKGIAVAKGEYLQFLNSGDWLVSDTILSEVSKMCPEEFDIIYGDVIYFENNSLNRDFKFPSELTLSFFYERSLGHNASFIKRQLLLENKYDETNKIVSDWKFFFQAAIANKSFFHIDKHICCYDCNGISSTDFGLLCQEKADVLNHLCPILLQRDFECKKQTESHLAHVSVFEFNSLCDHHRFISKIITALVLLMKRLSGGQ
ncbi:MAG: glycosyltransferase [Bacteroidales bacterium]|nr:glycosyltransferase [Bacteroidales bacterium]